MSASAAVSTNFLDLCDAVKNYYGTGSDQWVEISKYGMASEDFATIVKQVPGVSVNMSQSGKVLGYSIDVMENTGTGLPSIAQQVNSNVGGGGVLADSANLKIPASNSVSGGTAAATSGVTREYSGGSLVQTGGKFVTGTVLPAVLCASAGIAAAKKVDAFLYETLPYFFDNIDVSTLNPETWGEIIQDYDGPGFLKGAFSLIFGVDDTTGNMQAYADDRAVAYMMQYLATQSFFDAGSERTGDTIVTTGLYNSNWLRSAQPLVLTSNFIGVPYQSTEWYLGTWTAQSVSSAAPVYLVPLKTNSTSEQTFIYLALIGSQPWTVTATVSYSGATNTYSGSRQTTAAGEVFYVWSPIKTTTQIPFNRVEYSGSVENSDITKDVWHIINTAGVVMESAVPGVEPLPGGTAPNTTGWDTPQHTLDSLQQQYPDWWNNRLENDVIQPDGSVETIRYIPIPLPDGFADNGLQPTSSGDTSTQLNPFISPDPDNTTDTLLQTLIDLITGLQPSGMTDPETSPGADQDNPLNPETNPPETGEGNTPTIVMPSGSASSLWTVYNPTQAQVDSFGAWLWSSSFIEQVKKLFADPMQGIIGIHKIFATPIISGTGNIVCGYLDSGVSSNIVGSQYTTINCGSVYLPEFYGNVLDYTDTELYIFLPFIGIQKLDIGQCMRGVINVTYHVDIYTGACLAEISVTRDNAGGVLYSYSGDCAVRYPLSSGSYMGIVSGILTTVGAVAGGIMTGNPLLAGMGAINGLGSMHADVQRSGSLSGNAGAMGIKKPYLIINRPQTTYTAFAGLQGYGANAAIRVTDVSGYAKFTDIKCDIAGATEEERQKLISLLQTGVYL